MEMQFFVRPGDEINIMSSGRSAIEMAFISRFREKIIVFTIMRN
jgi:hypothetical protein